MRLADNRGQYDLSRIKCAYLRKRKLLYKGSMENVTVVIITHTLPVLEVEVSVSFFIFSSVRSEDSEYKHQYSNVSYYKNPLLAM